MGIVVIALPGFYNQLARALEFLERAGVNKMAHIDYGAVRLLMKYEHLLGQVGPEMKLSEKESFVEIDEIELEPIPINDDPSSGN